MIRSHDPTHPRLQMLLASGVVTPEEMLKLFDLAQPSGSIRRHGGRHAIRARVAFALRRPLHGSVMSYPEIASVLGWKGHASAWLAVKRHERAVAALEGKEPA